MRSGMTTQRPRKSFGTPWNSIFAPRATRLVAGTFASVAIADFLQIAYRLGQKKL